MLDMSTYAKPSSPASNVAPGDDAACSAEIAPRGDTSA